MKCTFSNDPGICFYFELSIFNLVSSPSSKADSNSLPCPLAYQSHSSTAFAVGFGPYPTFLLFP